MCRYISYIVIGVVFLIGGLSGTLVLKGTDSGTFLAIAGILITIYGIWRFTTTTKSANPHPSIQPTNKRINQ